MADPLLSIIDYLETKGVGTEATDLFMGHVPPTPENCIVLIPTPGIYDPNSILHSYDKGTFQVYVRNLNTATAIEKINAVYNWLQGLSGVELSGTYFVEIIALQNRYTLLGKDGLNRTQLVQNYRYEIYNPTANRI